MKNKLKWIVNVTILCLYICALAICVYAINGSDLPLTGSIGYEIVKVNAKISNVSLTGSTQNYTFQNEYNLNTNKKQETISSQFANWLSLPLRFDEDGSDITISFDIQNTVNVNNYYMELDYSVSFSNPDTSIKNYNVYATPNIDNDYIIAQNENVNFSLTFKVVNSNEAVPQGTKYNLNIGFKTIEPKTLTYNESYDGYFYQDIQYLLDEDSLTAEVERYINAPTNVVIPAVVTDGTKFYEVTTIGGYSFFGYEDDFYEGCHSLKSVTFPNSLRTIEMYAFGGDDGIGSSSLTEVKLPVSLLSLGECAFANCASLKKVTVTSPLTDMSSGSIFYYDTALEEVILPDGITELGSSMFIHCSSITKITLPNGLEKIGGYVFGNCSDLFEIEIPRTLHEVGNSAFYECGSLIYVYYPGSQSEWGNITIGSDNDDLLDASIVYDYQG